MSRQARRVTELVRSTRMYQTAREHMRRGPQQIDLTVDAGLYFTLLFLLVMVYLPGDTDVHRIPFTGFLGEKFKMNNIKT